MNFIHIGFPKCASSTLQANVFSRLQNYEFIGPASLSNVTGTIQIKQHDQSTLLHNEILSYVLSASNTVPEHLVSSLQKLQEKKSSYIFSSEWITGIRYQHNLIDDQLNKLASIFGYQNTVIMVVRPHLDLLGAMFRDSPRSITSGKSCENFDEFYFDCIKHEIFIDGLYSSVYKTCNKLFEQVEVFHLTKYSAEDFIHEVKALLDVSYLDLPVNLQNKGVTRHQYAYLAFIRMFNLTKLPIPKSLKSCVHEALLRLLSSGSKYELTFSDQILKDAAERFKNDWDFIESKDKIPTRKLK